MYRFKKNIFLQKLPFLSTLAGRSKNHRLLLHEIEGVSYSMAMDLRWGLNNSLS